MAGLPQESSTPPSQLLSEETKQEISQTVIAAKDAVNDLVTAGWNQWDMEGFGEEDIPSAVDRMLDRLAGATKAQQITAGGASGWVTGFLFNKFGRPILYLGGATIIIALFAEHQGYLKIDWSKVRQDASAGRRAVTNRIHTLQTTGILARKNGRPWLRKLQNLAQSSPYLTGGYIGGVLLGLAS
ncbi:hypothetical protein BV898_02772 [Hypsibius exemplaris]|uniref:FUN14 domain-containing protein 1 n=1 Tax=Hypsibius exemplaris TaxID=2072580 RepID=A0A1W0X723_HYPEX|nr:hypothetical protein BV898_02772 [Hypsibius exemplaris]